MPAHMEDDFSPQPEKRCSRYQNTLCSCCVVHYPEVLWFTCKWLGRIIQDRGLAGTEDADAYMDLLEAGMKNSASFD
jgi:hypothetical protein